MATITELQADLAKFRAARDKILEGNQSYTVGGSSFTRADLRTINDEIKRLEKRLEMAQINEGSLPPLHSTVTFGGVR